MTATAQLRPEAPFLVPPLTDPVFDEEPNQKSIDMLWYIAGAFRLAVNAPLTADEIVGLVKEHQPWKIHESRRPKNLRETAVKRNIRFILSSSPAFDHVGAGHWRMNGMPLVRTKEMLQKWLTKTAKENQVYCDWVDNLLATGTA
ncbi:hypothetical protein FRC05_002614 [Tulasnella sp. 425]|nr:hypothetical protein FRC05_002614 [Tulasnella sp. 425]